MSHHWIIFVLQSWHECFQNEVFPGSQKARESQPASGKFALVARAHPTFVNPYGLDEGVQFDVKVW